MKILNRDRVYLFRKHIFTRPYVFFYFLDPRGAIRTFLASTPGSGFFSSNQGGISMGAEPPTYGVFRSWGVCSLMYKLCCQGKKFHRTVHKSALDCI
jgi:hypothetical protein